MAFPAVSFIALHHDTLAHTPLLLQHLFLVPCDHLTRSNSRHIPIAVNHSEVHYSIPDCGSLGLDSIPAADAQPSQPVDEIVPGEN